MTKGKLKKIKIFEKLSDKQLQQVIDISIVKKFSRDNILFYEGEMPQYFYILLEGHVKFYKSDLKGAELVLHYFTKPILMAEMPSLENISFRATAIAMKDETNILLIHRDKFLVLLRDNPKLSFDIIKSLSQKIRELEVAINRNLIYDATAKVCSFILESPQDLVTQKQKEIATLLNMAPETLSRVLKKLKNIGIINKNLELIDRQKVEMFLDF